MINQLELLRGELQKLLVIIDNVKMMNHIISNLPRQYENIVKNLEYKLDDKIDMLMIKIIWEKKTAKSDKIDARSNLGK